MLEFQSQQTKIIHVESTQNSSLQYSSSSVFQFSMFSSFAFSTPLFRLVVFFGSTFFSSDRSAFSTPNLYFSSLNLRFLDLIFEIVSSSSFGFGSVSSILHIVFIFVLQILLESRKLEFHVDKFLHLSTRLQSLRLDFITKLKF